MMKSEMFRLFVRNSCSSLSMAVQFPHANAGTDATGVGQGGTTTLDGCRPFVQCGDPTAANQEDKPHSVVPVARRAPVEPKHVGNVPGQAGGLRAPAIEEL